MIYDSHKSSARDTRIYIFSPDMEALLSRTGALSPPKALDDRVTN